MPPVLSRHRDTIASKEQDNLIRINMVLFEIGTKCVRKVFDGEVDPIKLATVLGANRFELQKILNSSQLKLLYPPRGSPPVTSLMFDMTLMMRLLKHLTELSIVDMLPFETDHTIAADLSRLKHYRNSSCHLPAYSISDHMFEELYNEIAQVIARLGPEWKKECEHIRVCCLDERLNDVKFLLLQLFLILHTKGYDMSSKVSVKFWSFSPIHQLRFILSFLGLHFWVFPQISEIWNAFQDSVHLDSDIKFFERTECKSSKQDVDCFPRPSTATGTMPQGGYHAIEIVCRNCPNIIEKEVSKSEAQQTNNTIKMTCSCKTGLFKAEICFITLFSQLNPIHYRHYGTTTNDNSEDSHQQTGIGLYTFICKNEETYVVQGKSRKATHSYANKYPLESLIEEKLPSKNIVSLSSRNDYLKCMYANPSTLCLPRNYSHCGVCGKKILLE